MSAIFVSAQESDAAAKRYPKRGPAAARKTMAAATRSPAGVVCPLGRCPGMAAGQPVAGRAGRGAGQLPAPRPSCRNAPRPW
jgi:hypothetical protein